MTPATAPRKKEAAKKAAAKKTAKKTTIRRPARREQVDVSKLSDDETKRRVARIYKLESDVEKRRVEFEYARDEAKAARDALKSAEAKLATEIDEQRFGPGPLFSPNGKGPAGS